MKNKHTMAMLQVMSMMTGKLPEFTIKRAPKTYSGQGSRERQRRLRQQQRKADA